MLRELNVSDVDHYRMLQNRMFQHSPNGCDDIQLITSSGSAAFVDALQGKGPSSPDDHTQPKWGYQKKSKGLSWAFETLLDFRNLFSPQNQAREECWAQFDSAPCILGKSKIILRSFHQTLTGTYHPYTPYPLEILFAEPYFRRWHPSIWWWRFNPAQPKRCSPFPKIVQNH